MILESALGYDDSVTSLRIARPFSLFASLSMLAALGCSEAADDGPDGPRYMGAPSPTPPTGPAAAPANGNTPAPSSPAPTPPGSEGTPVAGGVDPGAASPGTSGAAAPGTGTTPPATMPPTPGDTGMQAPSTAAASPGCGLSAGIPQNVTVDSTILTYPEGYDGSTPVPLVFAFHGAGRTNREQQRDDSRTIGSELERNYVMAFVKSAGNAWDLGTDYPRFQAIRTQIFSQLCVDTEHVFAFGHSSGAQFIVQMLGNPNTRESGFAAVAPVSSSRYGNPAWPPVPTLLIHGLNDTARPGDNDGAMDIAQYAESNQCSNDTTELAVPTCTSLAQNAQVDPGCVEYVGCAAPTLFCNHDDPNYLDNGNPTNHGWPCFANSEIFRFFEAQR
jgi:polyhydroxybutyrate depolymerase